MLHQKYAYGASNVFCESNDRSNLSLLKFIISLTTRFYLIHFSPASVLPSCPIMHQGGRETGAMHALMS
uniref:Uncharacterized protein n=1 Tax=Musa acuminata subsp. malaccensis TaxID=214687 RepID=A0A804IBM8_MUSAM